VLQSSDPAHRVAFGPRRALRLDVPLTDVAAPDAPEVADFEKLDLVYRSLCALLYNYAPMSGHPGGSISSGRFVEALLFRSVDLDLSDPDRPDADVVSYAAGHKALGLYALWALRNEIARIARPRLLPADPARQLRLEDLLGFRRNPTTRTPLFLSMGSKALDGHPTPATPFVKLATGASGVGVASSFGLALAALDVYGDDAPRVHVVEGEGGLTPGRVSEALAFAGTARIRNLVVHLDWNQASIDTDRVTREGDRPGDYVQWDPGELFYLHDWNVVQVPDGHDLGAIFEAQQRALDLDNGQPTAIVYRTVKGWNYGIQGRGSHGAGHKLCSPGFYEALAPLTREVGLMLPVCGPGSDCKDGTDAVALERCAWTSLQMVRGLLESNRALVNRLAERLLESRERLLERDRHPRPNAPRLARIHEAAARGDVPAELALTAGTTTTLRGQLGKILGHLNLASHGALFVAAADLLGSTSLNEAVKGHASGWFQGWGNPDARALAVGGICEDAMAGVLSGISAFGWHMGVGSSYGAFIAPLGHIAARLHAIGNQARRAAPGASEGEGRPMFLVCGHAGLKTGEDGPTHADPQPLQLLQENFPRGTLITLTPWDPGELWHLVCAALRRRPSVIAPFVTRPVERVLDRAALGLAPASAAASGVYLLRAARGPPDGTVVLQESGVAYAFLEEALPLLDQAGIDLQVYYVASAELFDLLPASVQRTLYPDQAADEAMGITGFTLPTLHRWVRSTLGRDHSMHPFQHGHFLGSGKADAVLREAGLDGESQFRRVLAYVERRGRSRAQRADEPRPGEAGVR
jgi:transketolase